VDLSWIFGRAEEEKKEEKPPTSPGLALARIPSLKQQTIESMRKAQTDSIWALEEAAATMQDSAADLDFEAILIVEDEEEDAA
jgi:hypothetical protein